MNILSNKSNSVTIAKAIGIVLMVVGHSGPPLHANNFIYLFHMPLFFILSGYCFKEKYLADLRGFTWRRIKGIYWPFVKWSLVFLALHNVFFHINIYNGEYGWGDSVSTLYTRNDYWWRTKFIVTSMMYNEQLLGGYWFLHTLFVASFIGYACIYVRRYIAIGGGKSGQLLLASIFPLILLAIGNLSLAFDVKLDRIDVGHKEMMAAAFFVIGYELKMFKMALSWPMTLACFAIVFIASCVHPTNMTSIGYNAFIPYSFVAIIGTIMTMSVASRADRLPLRINRLLEYIGTHTMQILTWHFISFKLTSLFVIWFEGRPITHLAMFTIIRSVDDYPLTINWWLFYFIVGVGIPLLLCVSIDKIKSLCKHE